jgi:acyl dehydratase
MTNSTDLAALAVGDTLPPHVQGPINRATLALFAGASNDYVPLHIDSDFAKAAGMDDVFGHGMLSMAYLAQLVTHWVPQERLLSWNVRFTSITPLYATVTATGEVTEIFDDGASRCARVAVRTVTDKGATTIDGEAVIRIN